MGELGTRRTTERVRVGHSPPKAARTVFLPDAQRNHSTYKRCKLDVQYFAGPYYFWCLVVRYEYHEQSSYQWASLAMASFC